MTRPILLAGLLGGLLGGAAAVAAVKLLASPAEGAKVEPQSQAGQPVAGPAEARAMAEAYLAKLRNLKYDEFVAEVKNGMTFQSEPEFEAFKKAFADSRNLYHAAYGKLTGEYELVRETVARPDLVRLVYLEKFERGAVAWFFVLYKTRDGWRLNGIVWNKDLVHVFPSAT